MNNIVSFANGRFANQLYYLLQAYKNGDKYHPYNVSKDILEYFTLLEMDDLIDFESKDVIKIQSYCQNIDQDFTLKHVISFISTRILNSKYFKNTLNNFGLNDKDILLYIRCGDYIGANSKTHNIFDRFDYLEKAFNKVNGKFEKIIVQSDDINYCQNNYRKIIEKYFNNIEWYKSGTILDDFIHLCSFKNKIIWNSTYSIWSTFISNVIFEDSYQNIICPHASSIADDFNKISPIYNAQWNIIQVIKNKGN